MSETAYHYTAPCAGGCGVLVLVTRPHDRVACRPCRRVDRSLAPAVRRARRQPEAESTPGA